MRTYYILDCTTLTTIRRMPDVASDGEALAVFQATLPVLGRPGVPLRLISEDRVRHTSGAQLVKTRRLADAYSQRTLTATVRELLGLAPAVGAIVSYRA